MFYNSSTLQLRLYLSMFLRIFKPLAQLVKQQINMKLYFNFTQNKKSNPTLLDQMHNYADNIGPSISEEDQSQFALKYVQLTQQSFAQFAKRSNSNPQMMLMMLSTFQNPKKVAEFLPALYPSINLLQKKEMLLLLQKILAYKPTTKPRIPHPKPLEQIQSVLVILSELYSCDLLIDWIKYIPVYRGSSAYILSMGYFSILEKMSVQTKNKNRALLVRCHQRIEQILNNEQTQNAQKTGIASLAFQLNYGQALPLFFASQIDYTQLDPYKICLLFTNLSKYLSKQLKKPQQVRNIEREKAADKEIKQIMKVMQKLNFGEFIKIQVMMEMWKAFLSQQTLKGSYLPLVDKISRICVEKDYQRSMKQLNVQELLTILECMEKHKINKQTLLKTILIYLSGHLHNMEKRQFIRLLRCLVTFVRQCEDYLIDVRRILEERKLQFSEKDSVEINQILRRVSVLFPKPFQSG